MSEAKHTPGPWLTEPGDTVICVRVTAAHDSYRIADVGGMPYWKKFTETDAANASLIAAAPDLLAALHEVVATTKSGKDTVGFLIDLNRVARVCMAAIAKAEGRE